ncbi:MAG: uroporphyrinogen-III synthase [Pseudomonadota bacterium]
MDRQQPRRILVPRPAAAGARFAQAVEQAMPERWECVLAPILEIRLRPLTHMSAGGVVFTSANGVAAWSAAQNTCGRAYCVGPQTTRAATTAGFDAREYGSTAQDLAAAMRAEPPARLVHVRGAHVRGDLAGALRAAGHQVDEVIGYDQNPVPLPTPVLTDLGSGAFSAVTLFSPRSARLLVEAAPNLHRQTRLLCLSDAVAAATGRAPGQCIVAPQPNRAGMLSALCRLNA